MEGEQNAAKSQKGLSARVGNCDASLCEVAPAVLDEETESVPDAPEDEVDGDAVPQADEEHRGELTEQEHRPCGDGFVAANPAIEGIEKVRANPLRQRDVPTVPELRDVGLCVWRGEVFGEFDSDETRDANGNVGIAAEVEINLEGVGVEDDPHPTRCADLDCKRVVERHQCQRVGDDEFFEQTNDDPLTCEQRFILREMKFFSQVSREAFGAVNGTSGERGEENNVGCKFRQGEFGQSSRLPVAQDVNEAEGDVRKSQPAQIQCGGGFDGAVRQRAEEGAGLEREKWGFEN